MQRIACTGEGNIKCGVASRNRAWRGVLNHFIEFEVFEESPGINFLVVGHLDVVFFKFCNRFVQFNQTLRGFNMMMLHQFIIHHHSAAASFIGLF